MVPKTINSHPLEILCVLWIPQEKDPEKDPEEGFTMLCVHLCSHYRGPRLPPIVTIAFVCLGVAPARILHRGGAGIRRRRAPITPNWIALPERDGFWLRAHHSTISAPYMEHG